MLPPEVLEQIRTPAYVADLPRIRQNMAVVDQLKTETGCTVLLALKAFALPELFDEFRPYLDGTTASGYVEAQLGYEYFGGQVHTYSPAYTDEEIEALLPICRHISFNSLAQFKRYAPKFQQRYGRDAVVGLRVNPALRQVKNSELYDPSAPRSRFGVACDTLTEEVMESTNLLHVHNLCDNMAEDSAALIDHLMHTIPHALEKVDFLNLGGGHYLTHPDYDLELLITAVNRIQERFKVQVILEPGGALVYDAGYLVATVLDIIENKGNIAVLDTSATCHMPDVLEVPYTPHVIGTGNGYPHHYRLTGKTCLTGDVIGDYAFAEPLEIGSRVTFTDMLQYTMVKTTTFNGLPPPGIGIWNNGFYQEIV